MTNPADRDLTQDTKIPVANWQRLYVASTMTELKS